MLHFARKKIFFLLVLSLLTFSSMSALISCNSTNNTNDETDSPDKKEYTFPSFSSATKAYSEILEYIKTLKTCTIQNNDYSNFSNTETARQNILVKLNEILQVDISKELPSDIISSINALFQNLSLSAQVLSNPITQEIENSNIAIQNINDAILKLENFYSTSLFSNLNNMALTQTLGYNFDQFQ